MGDRVTLLLTPRTYGRVHRRRTFSQLNPCNTCTMMILVILLISGVCSDELPDSFSRHWVKRFVGFLPGSGHLNMFPAKSPIHCANYCALDPRCKSLFFVKDIINNCQHHPAKFQVSGPGLSSWASAAYYEMDDPDTSSSSTTTASTTTTTATTTTPAGVCPPDDTVFRAVTLPGGSTFQYRIFMDTPRTFSEAETHCNNLGTELYQILTPEKFSFTQELMNCPAYSAKHFWVNGVYNALSNQWETTDGTQLPMTSTYWYPSRPNNPGTENCVWLQADKGHYFDDYQCIPDVEWPVNTICEM